MVQKAIATRPCRELPLRTRLERPQLDAECELRSCTRGRRERDYLRPRDVRRGPSPTDLAVLGGLPPTFCLSVAKGLCSRRYRTVQLVPQQPSVDRTPTQQLTRPARPKTAQVPFWTPRSPWHLHQYQSVIRTWRRDSVLATNQRRRNARLGAHN
ncbi:hypothetical protein TREES_T100021645 [Tupaia chinensis]|uniref:Uncharacterized protein n=1 Tax=Tupaia chinensis TaxID=246437 RepID=L9JVG5_TUPCH|nr:hypothetical protein TREES_T100021645 [Tupaia chinensis]